MERIQLCEVKCLKMSENVTKSLIEKVLNPQNIKQNIRQLISDSTCYIILTNKVQYEDCLNMNASSFITFFTYMQRHNGIRFYKGLYVTFKLAQGLKKYTVYLLSYSPLNEGHFSILTNSVLRTYTKNR